ncbi:MAG: hypothetical protein GKR88_00340 [Flavobacteriaceae bacterium]|nr:MAG: hypothetical protein GKR88_00340 [Flavobacteriaceae bacterium]
MEKDNQNMISKWLNNELSSEELKSLTDVEEYKEISRLDDTLKGFKADDYDVEKNHRLLMESIKQPVKTKVIYLRRMYRVAAIIIVTLGIFFITDSLNKTQHIATQIGEKTEFTLPDKSQVSLNAGSSIRYAEKEWPNTRNIDLDGEAFFKVAKGEKFSVHTLLGEVVVLGTAFNVFARENLFRVTCYEGKVKVVFNNETVYLSEEEHLQFIKTDSSYTKKKITIDAPTWLDNYSTFSSVPVKYVFQEFENQYHVTVKSDTIDVSQLFSGTLIHDDIVVAAKSIAIPLGLKFEIKKDVIVFSK